MFTKDKLLTWEYYYQKLPLYIRNSYGLPEHFKMIVDSMKVLDDNEQNVCKSFFIMDKDYLTFMHKYTTDDKKDFIILDYLAKLYGVSRNMQVQYSDDTGQIHTLTLHLTNKELYILIKAKILQNTYDGTYLQCKQYYNKLDIPIYFYTDDLESAICYLYLGSNDNTTDNIKTLFRAGYFTLKSMGIVYKYSMIDYDYLGIWGKDGYEMTSHNTWNVSLWS